MSSERPPAQSPSRLAAPVAYAILDAFRDCRARFLALTSVAQERFERKDWAGLRRDAQARLGLYRVSVDHAEARTRALLGAHSRERLVWVSAKAVYSTLIAHRQDWELAETFFNGVTRRIFDTVGLDPLVEYVATDFDTPPIEATRPMYVRDVKTSTTTALVRAILDALPFECPWRAVDEDAALVAERVEQKVAELHRGGLVAIERIEPLFYRGKAAYVVGRLVLPAGAVSPFLLALRNGADGLYVDAALLEPHDVTVAFSFTHSYFHVVVERPYDVMRFLRSLVPQKRIAELYIAIGEPKQGKTELYRALMDHIAEAHEAFSFARGTPGLVMVVFTMPGLDLVLKVIRDEFPPEKDTSFERVKDRYQWVYQQDRAGRMVDAQPFEFLAFDRSRFEPEVLEELLSQCGDSVHADGDRIVIDYCYVEREIYPLNLYVREKSQEEAEAALTDWGRAIADITACGVFVGDLLLKNFGVTRLGRVALYDYDELVALDAIHFRDLPETADPEDELRAEPWFSVSHGDVFPEEFPRFLGLPRRLRPHVLNRCKHVFDPRWWRRMQSRVAAGMVREFAPYPDQRRLHPLFGGARR
ncbi:MAG: bifunctional isocitrate dehydrogenase kinase/phosphatase [Sandaracinaceae bacterium]